MIGCQGPEERSQNRRPERDLETFSSFAYFFCKKSGHIKKNCMKYKKMLKKRGNKDSDRASTSEKSDQADVIEEADENHMIS